MKIKVIHKDGMLELLSNVKSFKHEHGSIWIELEPGGFMWHHYSYHIKRLEVEL